MVNITKHNYEKYIIDYLEGNLSQQLETKFSDFLSQNPDIKAEIYEFSSVSLSPAENNLENKFLLKKSALSEHFQGNYFEELCIADIEGDITEAQKTDLQKILIEYPEKLSEYKDLKKTIYKSDKTIVFNNKEQLKKKTYYIGAAVNRKKVLYTISAIAASIVIFFSIINFQKLNSQINALSGVASIHTPLNNRPVINKTIENNNDNNTNINYNTNKNIKVVHKNTETDTTEKRIYNKDNFKTINNNISYKVKAQPEAIQMMKSENYIEYIVPEEKTFLSGAKDSFRNRKERISNEINQINTITVAQAVVKEYNTLTENNISIEGQYDENGNLSTIAFNTGEFSYFTNKFKKNK